MTVLFCPSIFQKLSIFLKKITTDVTVTLKVLINKLVKKYIAVSLLLLVSCLMNAGLSRCPSKQSMYALQS